ncbi:MAG: hypothetical protein V9F04_14515 [Dermatophilaceae bacterium]
MPLPVRLASLAASTGATLQRHEPELHLPQPDEQRRQHGWLLTSTDLYDRDHRLVVGHLCGVSDQRRFGWGLS